jgi:hypothetical protein
MCVLIRAADEDHLQIGQWDNGIFTTGTYRIYYRLLLYVLHKTMGYLLQALTVFITGSYYMYYIRQWDIYYRHLLYLLQALTICTT